MKKFVFAGAAMLAFALPATAQDVAVTADGDVYVLTDSQETLYAGWPVERRTMYDAWPNTYKTYYWTLTEPQQTGWWALTDDQRARVYAMTPEQRTAAWTSIAAQMAGANTGASATAVANRNASATGEMASASASSNMGNMQYVRSEMVQSTPAGYTQATEGADLPVCSKNQQDGCINSWEKNKTGTRPLNYWPGKPASEIPGDKPMK